ncbi:MAG: methyltransferase domain-containing protein [bacterium]
MKIKFRKIYKKISSIVLLKSKKKVELEFWKEMVAEYTKWYKGGIESLFGEKNPEEKNKIYVNSIKDSAILTWHKIHQEQKYLEDLVLKENAFEGKKVLDIGSGPIPSATAFKNSDLYCLDPLLGDYINIGYPIHYYGQTKFICSHSENIPISDNFFDAVISVNAIDHVNDLLKTSLEIKRVLKEGGTLRMHVHYHKKTQAEPIEINDEIMKEIFSWCKNFKKISESNSKRGYTLSKGGGIYTVWSN